MSFPDLQKHTPHELEYSGTEYIMDVYGTNAGFTTVSFPINPGLSETFTLLSGISTTFETYRFKKLTFYYKPMVADLISSSNTTLGTVGMAFTYDPDDPSQVNANQPQTSSSFPNKSSFMNYEGSVSVRPDQPLIFNVDCRHGHRRNPLYFVRQGESKGIDIRLSDLGIFWLAVAQQQSIGILGELYCKYTVEFQKSKPNYSLSNSNRYAHYRLTDPSVTDWFGTSRTAMAGTNLSLNFQETSLVNRFYLPRSTNLCNYVIMYHLTGTSGSWAFGTALYNAALNILDGGNNNIYPTSSVGSQTTMQGLWFIKGSLSNTPNLYQPAFAFLKNTGTVLASPSYADLFVFQIPSYATE